MLLKDNGSSYYSQSYYFLLLPNFVPDKEKKRLALSESETCVSGEDAIGPLGLFTGLSGFSGLASYAIVGTEEVSPLFWQIPCGLVGTAVLILTPFAYVSARHHFHKKTVEDFVGQDKLVRFALCGDKISTSSHALNTLMETGIGEKFVSLLKEDGNRTAITSRKEMKRLLKSKSPNDSELTSIIPLIVEYLYKTKPVEVALRRNAERPEERLNESKQLIADMAGIYAKRIWRELEDREVQKIGAADSELASANDQLRSYLEVERITDGELSQ